MIKNTEGKMNLQFEFGLTPLNSILLALIGAGGVFLLLRLLKMMQKRQQQKVIFQEKILKAYLKKSVPAKYGKCSKCQVPFRLNEKKDNDPRFVIYKGHEDQAIAQAIALEKFPKSLENKVRQILVESKDPDEPFVNFARVICLDCSKIDVVKL